MGLLLSRESNLEVGKVSVGVSGRGEEEGKFVREWEVLDVVEPLEGVGVDRV